MSDSNSTAAAGNSGTGLEDDSSLILSLGAILIGSFVSIFLYGVTCLQVFIYYQRYQRDRPFIRYLVYVIWAIDSFDAALAVQICYFYLVSNYANPLAVSSPVWSLKLHVLVTSVSDFIVRSLFTRRIYTLSHGNKIIAGSILVLSVVDLVVGTIITARAFGIPTFAGLSALARMFDVNFATNIVADLTVAGVLSYYLWTNKTGFRRTDSLVDKLIVYTINTGAITVIDATLGLICYLVMPNTLLFIAFYLNLSKLYVNSYLASLNVRKTLLSSMHAGESDGGISISLSHARSPGLSGNMPEFRSIGATGLSIGGGGGGGSSSTSGYSGSNGQRRHGYGHGHETINLDLEIGTGTGSSQSKGDLSTAVNTPIDGMGVDSLSDADNDNEKPDVIDTDEHHEHRYPPGVLLPATAANDSDKNGEVDPGDQETSSEASPTKGNDTDEVPQRK